MQLNIKWLLFSLSNLLNIFGLFLDRITDCVYIGNSTELVKLFCTDSYGTDDDNFNETVQKPDEIRSKDDCYSSLFHSDVMEINRSNVKSLKMGECQSQTIDQSLAKAFGNVTDLDISHLGINSRDFDLGFDFLEQLNASHNEIGSIPSEIFDYMENLSVIDFSHNKIISIFSDTFEGADALASIDLSHNELANLESSAFQYLTELQLVDLSDNFLETFDIGAFTYNENLRSIRLENNRIKRFVYYFGFIPVFDRLNNFSIEGNQIENISDTIIRCLGKALQRLNLSGNPMKRLNVTTFKGLTDLQYLNLSHINLAHFEAGTFEQLEHLKLLDLSYNRLTNVEFGSDGNFKNLETLNLESNNLNEINSVLPARFPKLNTFGVAKNRLSCDYATKLVHQWETLEIIGDPCDQVEIEPIRVYFNAQNVWMIIIGTGFGLIVIAASFVCHRKRRLCECDQKENQYDEPIFLENLRREEIVDEVMIILQPANGEPVRDEPQHEEPIYQEIDARVANRDRNQYDRLRFAALPLRAILSHYHRLIRRQ